MAVFGRLPEARPARLNCRVRSHLFVILRQHHLVDTRLSRTPPLPGRLAQRGLGADQPTAGHVLSSIHPGKRKQEPAVGQEIFRNVSKTAPLDGSFSAMFSPGRNQTAQTSASLLTVYRS